LSVGRPSRRSARQLTGRAGGVARPHPCFVEVPRVGPQDKVTGDVRFGLEGLRQRGFFALRTWPGCAPARWRRVGTSRAVGLTKQAPPTPEQAQLGLGGVRRQPGAYLDATRAAQLLSIMVWMAAPDHWMTTASCRNCSGKCSRSASLRMAAGHPGRRRTASSRSTSDLCSDDCSRRAPRALVPRR
jgi:hypothetical protein